MTPAEILPRGAELRARLDNGSTEVHALIESMEINDALPDGNWSFLFREVGLHARLSLISAPRDLPRACLTIGCERCFTPIPIAIGLDLNALGSEMLFERCPTCGATV